MLIFVSVSLCFVFSCILGKHYFPFSQELFFLSFSNIYFLTIEFNIYPVGYAIHILYTLHSPLTRTFIKRRLGLWCRMIFTLYWVCTIWSLPSTECARNDLYLILSVHEMIFIVPFIENARNDHYLLLSVHEMIFTLCWVCTKWALPSTGVHEMIFTLYVSAKWVLPYTGHSVSGMIFTLILSIRVMQIL